MARGLACLFGRHQWQTQENRETQGTDLQCLRCGARRSTFPGDPQVQAKRRTPNSDGFGGSGSGR